MVIKQPQSVVNLWLMMMLLLTGHWSTAYADDPQLGRIQMLASNSSSPAGQNQVGTFSRAFIPGDAVEVSTYPDTTFFLNNIYPIDDAGNIELPIYGKTRISQMTQLDFVNFLLEKYKDYLRFPNIQVKPLIRLSVLGGVQRPGFYYFDKDYSLWEVMRMVGGTLDENGIKESRWKRDGNDVESNLFPFIQSGVALKNISFRSGDQIWVKSPNKPGFLEKSRVYLNFVTAIASFFTLYLSYQSVLIGRRR